MKRILMSLMVLLGCSSGHSSAQSPDPGFTNSLGMGFVEIDRTPILMAKWEVRVKDFRSFLEESGFEWDGKPSFEQAGDHPVVGISQSDARIFCQWLTERELQSGVLKSGQRYRLPTDYEWSCAAGLQNVTADSSAIERGLEEDRHFVWGEAWPPVSGAGNFAGDWIDGYEDSFPFTAPVGSFQPSGEGVYDLAGNVWEWVSNPAAKEGAPGLLRGGSFVYFRKENLLAGYRYQVGADLREPTFGFRLVLDDKERNEAFLSRQSSAQATGAEALRNALLPPEIETSPGEANGNLAGAALDGVFPEGGKPHRNSLGMLFVPVDGLPGILVGQHEVRVRDMEAFMKASDGDWKTKPKYKQSASHAAAGLTCATAESFCEWLTKTEAADELIASGQLYRLPSDEEWSVMANLRDERGSSPAANDTIGSPLFPWGVEWPPPPDSGNFESVSISGYSENVPYTAAVGTFQKGANGLFDLAGNVSEWVGDFWTPGSEDRVARGGSFFDYERTALLASRRMRIEGGVARGNIGFRCVLVTADR